MVSPENEGIVSKSPTLNWNANENAKSYRFQVATDSNFDNIITSKGTIVSNHYTIDLPENQTFFWRVRGVNTGGAGEWSETWSFTTENYAPTAIGISPSCIIDGSPIGTTVGDLITTDPDRKDTHTYSFAAGDGINDADNDSFIIEGNLLKTNVEIDYSLKTEYHINVQSNDGVGGIFTEPISIRVIPIGLVAYYPMDGNANDESANSNDGTISGATLSVDRFDSENRAYSFDGLDDYIFLGNGLNLINNEDSLTIAAWIYPYEISSSTDIIILNETVGGNNYNLVIQQGYLIFNFWSGGIQYGASLGTIIEAEKWQFVTVTYDGAYIRFYLNAEPDSYATPATGDIDGNNSVLFVSSSSHNYFYGKIDDLMIFNRALSLEEIADIYLNGI